MNSCILSQYEVSVLSCFQLVQPLGLLAMFHTSDQTLCLAAIRHESMSQEHASEHVDGLQNTDL